MRRLFVVTLIALAGATAAAGLFFALGVLKGGIVFAGLLLAVVSFYEPQVALSFMIAFSVGFPALDLNQSTGLPFSIGQMLGILTLGCWVVHALRQRGGLTFSPQFYALGGLIGIVLLSAVLYPGFAMVGLSRYAKLILVYLLVANIVTTRKRLLALCAVLTLTITINAALGLAEYAVPSFRIPTSDTVTAERAQEAGEDEGGGVDESIVRVSGGAGEWNWLAYMLAAVGPLNVFWFYHLRSWFWKSAVVVSGIMQLPAMVLTYTRSGILGLAAAAAYIVGWRGRAWWPAMLCLIALMVSAPLWLQSHFAERTFSGAYAKAGSTPVRMEYLRVGLEGVTERPLLGHGFGGFGPLYLSKARSFDAAGTFTGVERGDLNIWDVRCHSMYLEMLVEYGLFGFGVLCWFLYLVFADLRCAEQYGSALDRELGLYLRACLISFLVCAFFGNIIIMKIFWVLCGAAASLRRIAVQERSRVLMKPLSVNEHALPALSTVS